jgi:hypothetical protein
VAAAPLADIMVKHSDTATAREGRGSLPRHRTDAKSMTKRYFTSLRSMRS